MAGRSTNFKTDVNRMKTQKWAQAAKANYGGDDWGGYDEYDDYEEEPPPPPRPTGLRQRGQGTNSSSPESTTFAPGQLPQGSQAASQPQISQVSAAHQPLKRPRAGSFESGDDRHLVQSEAQLTPQHAQNPALPQPSVPSRYAPSAVAPAETTPSSSFKPQSPPPSLQQPQRPLQPPGQGVRKDSRGSPSEEARPSVGYPGFRPSPPGISPQQQSRQTPVIEGPYTGPGSNRQPQSRPPPPRQDSRGPPSMDRVPQPGQRPVPPPGNNNANRPSPGTGQPYGPRRGSNGTPPGQDPYARREHIPPGPHAAASSQRPRGPPPQELGPRKRPSQEFSMRKPPSQELRSRGTPSRERRPRQSPSQEFRPPPRKESLTHNQQPTISIAPEGPPESGPHPAEQTPERRPSPNAQDVPDETEDVPTSFVRPADIYRRVEKEREKERASMDSGRPSLDSIERTTRPNSHGPSGPRISLDSPREAGSSTWLKPTLDSVAERKSEYGMDGFLAKDPAFAAALGSQVDTGGTSLQAPSLPHFERFSSFNVEDLMNGKQPQTHPADNKNLASEEIPATSVDDGQTHDHPKELDSTNIPQSANSLPPLAVQDSNRTVRPDELQHQSSLGFRSAVDHAFEDDNDHSTLSPTSQRGGGSQRSKDGSDMSRSNTSDSTAGISPIMSRVPSAATAERRYREAEPRINVQEAIQEEAQESGSPSSRPTSGSTLTGLQQPPVLGSANNSRPNSTDSAALKAGYRRSMRPPSPSSIPARLTAVSARKGLEQRSHEGEIDVTTPVDYSHQASSPLQSQLATDLSTRESDLATQVEPHLRPEDTKPASNNVAAQAQSSLIASHPPAAMPAMPSIPTHPSGSPTSRSPSPSKSRVRDLANRYNDIHGDRATSPTGSVASWASSGKASPVRTEAESSLIPTAPVASVPDSQASRAATTRADAQKVADSAALPRPPLPGAWVSYQPSEASDAHSISDHYESATEQEREPASTSRLTTPKAQRRTSSDSVDFAPSTARQPWTGQTFSAQTQNPLAALSAAGAALADSVKQMAGADTPVAEEASTTQPTPLSPDEPATSASSAAPTPPLKDLPRSAAQQRSSGYFPPAAPLNIRKTEPMGQTEVEIREPSSAASGTSDRLSLDPSASDTEADTLRKDIARSLSPGQNTHGFDKLAPINERQSTLSAVLPQEYDAYWAQGPPGVSPKTPRFSSGSLGKVAAPETPGSPEDDPTIHSARSSRVGAASPLAPNDFRTSIDSMPKPASLGGARKASLASSGPVELDSPISQPARASPLSELAPVELPGESRPRPSTDKALPPGPALGHRRTDPMSNNDQTKPPAFKDIMKLSDHHQRVNAFNTAKDQFGSQHTGLNDWVRYMVDKNPDHAKAISAPVRPTNQSSGIAGTVRNKMPPSIAKLGKTNSGSPSSATGTSEASSPAPSQSRDSPSVSKRQELLHQANAFGGKATQVSKGLFAKGKSRLRGVSSEKEKTSSASSRRRSAATPSPLYEKPTAKGSTGANVASTADKATVTESGLTAAPKEFTTINAKANVPVRQDEAAASTTRPQDERLQPSHSEDHADIPEVRNAFRPKLPGDKIAHTQAPEDVIFDHRAMHHPPIYEPTKPPPLRPDAGTSRDRDGLTYGQESTTPPPQIIRGAYNPSAHPRYSYGARGYSTEKIAAPDGNDLGARGFTIWRDDRPAGPHQTSFNAHDPRQLSAEKEPANEAQYNTPTQLSRPRGASDAAPEAVQRSNQTPNEASHIQQATFQPGLAPRMQSEGGFDSEGTSLPPANRVELQQERLPKPHMMGTSLAAGDSGKRDQAQRITSESIGSDAVKPSDDIEGPDSKRFSTSSIPPQVRVYENCRDNSTSPERRESAGHGIRQYITNVRNRSRSRSRSRKSSMDEAPTPVWSPPPPLPQHQSQWSTSSMGVGPGASNQVPSMDQREPWMHPPGPTPQRVHNPLRSSVDERHPMGRPWSVSPPPPMPAIPASSPIDSNKRHYARKDDDATQSGTKEHNIGGPDRPPVPMKSRNRLSKRHSSQVPPPMTSFTDILPPDPPKKKRASMFGSILRRSNASDDEDLSKSQSNRLKKSNSRKITRDASEEPALPPVPASYFPRSETSTSLPRPPTATPQLPNLDRGAVVPGQREKNGRVTSASTPAPHLNEHTGFYGSAQTPTFEAAPGAVQFPTRDHPMPDRAEHIQYLQSQDMFPSRARGARPMYQSPIKDAHASAVPASESNKTRKPPHRMPSTASSVYTQNPLDEKIAAQPSDASSHYATAGDFAAQRRTRPLTQAYAQFARNPYDDTPDQSRRVSMGAPPTGGLAQYYQDARRPMGR